MASASDPRDDDEKSDRQEPKGKTEDSAPSQEAKRKRPRRPGLVIGPTTGDADVQLEW